MDVILVSTAEWVEEWCKDSSVTVVQGDQAIQQFLWVPSGYVIIEQVVNALGAEDRSKRFHVGVRKLRSIENEHTSKAYSDFTR